MFPDFIGIGAQRSGSGWLHRNLRLHPDIWLTPIKELHYFDSRERGIPEGILKKFFSKQWPHKGTKRLLAARLWAKRRNCRLSEWLWDYDFFFKERNDQWYGSLFEQGVGRCAGEITPSYAVLKKQSVTDIYKLMPHTKIIFMLRDPIDRAWSQAVKEFVKHKNRPLDTVTEDEWVECFTHPRVKDRSDYLRTLDMWGRFYPDEQIFTGFFEDVNDDPGGLLLNLYQFLGVEASERHLPPNRGNVVNAGYKSPIPPKWEAYLVQQYRDQIISVHERLGGRSTD